MNTSKTHLILIAAIVGSLLLTAHRANSQQLQAPVVSAQPQDQLARVGSDVILSFDADNLLFCQWMCNGVEIDSQTNTTLTLKNVQIADAGYYSCLVATRTQIEETSAASLEVYEFTPDNEIVVFAQPIVTTGNLGNCPGPYKGYVTYTKTVAQGWGWTPSTNTTVYTATDNNRTNTKVEFGGNYGDSGCAKTSVTVPYPTYSFVYRFAIYFTNNVPTTNYGITLSGFNP